MTILTRVKIGPLMQRVRRAAQLRRARGNARVFYAIVRRLTGLPIIRRVLHLGAVDFWRLQVADWSPPPTSLFTVRLAGSDDTELLAEYYGDRRRVEGRLAKGDRCAIACGQESIGAAVWLAIGPSHFAEDWDDLRCAFRFSTGVAWSYDGKGTKLGAWGTMMKQLPGLLLDEGVEEIATIIDCDNWKSMDGHRSLRYELAGVLLQVRIFGWVTRLWKPLQRRWQRIPPTIGRVELMRQWPAATAGEQSVCR